MHAGTKLSKDDEKALNDVLKKYHSKKLYLVQEFQKGRLTKSMGELKVNDKLESELAKAKMVGSTDSTVYSPPPVAEWSPRAGHSLKKEDAKKLVQNSNQFWRSIANSSSLYFLVDKRSIATTLLLGHLSLVLWVCSRNTILLVADGQTSLPDWATQSAKRIESAVAEGYAQHAQGLALLDQPPLPINIQRESTQAMDFRTCCP